MAWAGLPPGPHVIGVVNVTPDSFSDGGRSVAAAIAVAETMLADGAAIIDVGGESTRPGAHAVADGEQVRRVVSVIAHLARQGALVSIDTRSAPVMAAALDAGATIVNDVSGLAFDPAAAALVAARRCPVILMHMRGTPETMDRLARYDDLVANVRSELAATIGRAKASGVAGEQIAIDPGFGFAKDPAQTVEILRQLSHFVNLRCPIIAGLSRKSFLGTLTGIAEPAERDAASIAAGLFAVSQGASFLRVHDVRSTVSALRVWAALGASAAMDEGV